MAMTAERLWRDPVFRLGLLFKVALAVLLVPQIQQQWFVPFVQHAIAHPSLDPWSSFLAAGGDPMAYPYGPAMLLAHLPGTMLGLLASALTGVGDLTGVGFRFGLLGADLATLYLLSRLWPERPKRLLWLYWWSPIALYVTYWNGQTDIVPVALLLWSLLLLREYRVGLSGIALGLAMAAKFSMLLAAPFASAQQAPPAPQTWRRQGPGRAERGLKLIRDVFSHFRGAGGAAENGN